MIAKVLQISALCGLLGGGAFGAYHYERIHLPEFASLKSELLYAKCIRECEEVCTNNGLPLTICDCSHCKKYLVDDD